MYTETDSPEGPKKLRTQAYVPRIQADFKVDTYAEESRFDDDTCSRICENSKIRVTQQSMLYNVPRYDMEGKIVHCWLLWFMVSHDLEEKGGITAMP